MITNKSEVLDFAVLCWPSLAFVALDKTGLCTIDLFPTIRCQNQFPKAIVHFNHCEYSEVPNKRAVFLVRVLVY